MKMESRELYLSTLLRSKTAFVECLCIEHGSTGKRTDTQAAVKFFASCFYFDLAWIR